MPDQIEVAIRGAEAYNLARRALEQMERHKVWPTPLNYELWLHAISDPQGAIGREIQRIITSGENLTDALAEDLALQFLPRLRLTEEIRDTGDQLTRQLEAISVAINVAQRSTNEYGRTLEGATRELDSVPETAALRRVVENLSVSTRRVQKENAALEARLIQSTDEVKRLREHLEQVRRDAMTDALTSLANRKAFDEALAREMEAAAASGKPISVALLDIDHFKRFNDTWGHQTGDQVIRYVAALINRASVHPRMAARYGGEEFAMMFPGEDARSMASALDALREEISSRSLKRRSTAEDLGVVTVSAGVATVRPGESPSSALDRADKALYESKRGGRNRTTNAEAVLAA